MRLRDVGVATVNQGQRSTSNGNCSPTVEPHLKVILVITEGDMACYHRMESKE